MGELTSRIAVVYGAGGAIGGAVARALAREGARLFLTGRRLAPVEAVARDIVVAGGLAEAAEVDGLDEQAIDRHLQLVVSRAGRIDISFNAIGFSMSEALGPSLIDMDLGQFTGPIASYTTSYFLTARLAARRMLPNKSGVIMTVTAPPARIGSPNGGYGPSQAAKEALTRYLSAELAPHGLRVVCLRSYALLETKTLRVIFESIAEKQGVTWEQFAGHLADNTHPKRVMTLAELAKVAAFAASNEASAMTAVVNLSMGTMEG